MAETAVQEQFRDSLYLVEDQPMAELIDDQLARKEAARFIRNIGSTAIQGWETKLDFKPIENLEQAIKQADTDPVARQMVKANVRTEGIEQTLKAGHIMHVDLFSDESSVIYQHNQTLKSINANSLSLASGHHKMRERSEAETTNAFMLQRLFRLGQLEGKSFVVFSLAPDNMSTKEMDDVGFFTDTMSLTIQVTTIKDGQLQLESAFVAGIKEHNGARHDIPAIKLLARKMGLNFDDLTATEMLASPALIENEHMPDGAINIVEMLDECIDEVTGSTDTFFGQATSKQDYRHYQQYCELREKRFEPAIENATYELISQAGTISNPIDAIKKLHEITEKHMVLYAAIEDKSIDAWVFGPKAAPHIEMARWHIENGNIEQAQEEIAVSQKLADARSCPSGLLFKGSLTNEESNSPSSDDCEFISIECPICHKKNVKTTISRRGQRSLIKGSCGCSKVA